MNVLYEGQIDAPECHNNIILAVISQNCWVIFHNFLIVSKEIHFSNKFLKKSCFVEFLCESVSLLFTKFLFTQPARHTYLLLSISAGRRQHHSRRSCPQRPAWKRSSSPWPWQCPPWPGPGTSREAPHGRRTRSGFCHSARGLWRRSWSVGSETRRQVSGCENVGSTGKKRNPAALDIRATTKIKERKVLLQRPLTTYLVLKNILQNQEHTARWVFFSL